MWAADTYQGTKSRIRKIVQEAYGQIPARRGTKDARRHYFSGKIKSNKKYQDVCLLSSSSSSSAVYFQYKLLHQCM